MKYYLYLDGGPQHERVIEWDSAPYELAIAAPCEPFNPFEPPSADLPMFQTDYYKRYAYYGPLPGHYLYKYAGRI